MEYLSVIISTSSLALQWLIRSILKNEDAKYSLILRVSGWTIT